MRFLRFPVAAYFLLVFLSGAVVGALAWRYYALHSVRADDHRRQYIEEMRSRLHLRDDQLTQLNGILDRTRQRFSELREKMKPEMDLIRQEHAAKVRVILDDTQRAEYEKRRLEREERERREREQRGH